MVRHVESTWAQSSHWCPFSILRVPGYEGGCRARTREAYPTHLTPPGHSMTSQNKVYMNGAIPVPDNRMSRPNTSRAITIGIIHQILLCRMKSQSSNTTPFATVC